MDLIIRPAEAGDAESIGNLAAEFIEYLRALGDDAELKFDATIYLRDGFGENPAFAGIVAENTVKVIGYLLFHFGYDVDYATRTLHVIDLYVSEKHRKSGIGKALMELAAEICRDAGGTQLFWAVYAPNKAVIQFYERLGARFTKNLLFMRLEV